MMTSPLSSADTGLKQRVGRFFFAEEVPYGLALVRIFLPLTLIFPMAYRWSFTRELFSADGAVTPLFINYGFPNILPVFPGWLAVALMSALILFLLASALGWCTRFSLIASTILYTYFTLTDAVSTMTKYSVIASHVLLLLSCSGCGLVWSVDSWLKGARRSRAVWPGEPSLLQPTAPAWPRRLMQLLIGFVYFGAGITKMHTPAYFTGDQLQSWLVTEVNYENPVGEWVSLFPVLLVMGAYLTIAWEIVFIFKAWNGWGRILALSIGAGFHLMTFQLLGLYIFPAICLATYFAFLNENDVRRISGFLRRLLRRFGTVSLSRRVPGALPSIFRLPEAVRFPSWACFSFLAVTTAVVGVEIERSIDPYGERRPEGRYTLKELDADYVNNTLLKPWGRLRDVDKFSALKIGTFMVGELLAVERREFTHGDLLRAQCVLNSGHEDMWIGCSLVDADGREIDQVGSPVPREMLRATYHFRLTQALDPGRYSIVLKTAGRTVMRRQFTLKTSSSPKSPVAN